jgi:hypothetical protein
MVTDKILAVMADLTSLPKTDRNEHQRFTFRGVDAVVNAVGPLLRKHGLIVYPLHVGVESEVIATGQGKPMTRVVVTAEYRWQDAEGHIDVATVGEAFDAGDKATPKAMSVAYRTMILQTLCLPTDDPDPDSHTYTRDTPDTPKPAQSGVRRMWALLKEQHPRAEGESEDDWKVLIRAYLCDVIGREIQSSKELTPLEVSQVIYTLKGEGDAR